MNSNSQTTKLKNSKWINILLRLYNTHTNHFLQLSSNLLKIHIITVLIRNLMLITYHKAKFPLRIQRKIKPIWALNLMNQKLNSMIQWMINMRTSGLWICPTKLMFKEVLTHTQGNIKNKWDKPKNCKSN